MPAGPDLIEAVARCLEIERPSVPLIESRPKNHRRRIKMVKTELICGDSGKTPAMLKAELGSHVTTRAIRYAIAELIKSGRAQRKGTQGPVTAVREKT